MTIDWDTISEFDGPEQSPGFLLWQVSTSWKRKIAQALKQTGLTHPQFVLLASLGWLNHKHKTVSQVELAKHCRTDISTTSQVLRTLEKKKLINRKHLNNNEKTKFLTVTKQGSQLICESIILIEKVDHLFFAKLGKKLSEGVKLLQQLAD